ncbi:cytochrome b [Catenovulum sediminis]|uniref:Cytochrome b n=1 Tax=Catenovulum sediminis TaxID=1740262 RepID=A0ABV1RKR1_9ALTE|nr:cytochrome b [Catenovulum sediminis]
MNSTDKYSKLTRLCHWLSAILILALFAVGVWMVELSYYDDWYQKAPEQHKNFGLLLLCIMLIRLLSRLVSKAPPGLGKKWEQTAAKVTHIALYILIFLIISTGYLISTASGKDIIWFNWVHVPPIISYQDQQADIAGVVHQYAAYFMIFLAVIHVAAALKHQLIDKHKILQRML